MRTEFRKAILPDELRSLVIFDHKAFHEFKADWFGREYWKKFESWWMIAGNRKVGCCAFERHVDFREDLEGHNVSCRGSLYISSTGILPCMQGRGFGKLLKCWQITYARHHGFTQMVTNHRESNRRIIRLNQAFGFKIIRTTAGYYAEPAERVVVMKLKL